MKPRVVYLIGETKKKSHITGKCFKEGNGSNCKLMFSDEWVKLSYKGLYPKNIASYGILIGQYQDTGEFISNARARCKNYYHIDHGYFLRSDIDKFDGYFRIVKNSMFHNGQNEDFSWDRFNSFGIKLKDWRNNGEHIVLSPLSPFMENFLQNKTWTEDTIKELRKYTDREIIISKKVTTDNPNAIPMVEAMQNAWCVVTEHSNSAIDAMIEGIPAIFTNPSRKNAELSEIENPPMDREFFKNLANHQWTLEEIARGLPWE